VVANAEHRLAVGHRPGGQTRSMDPTPDDTKPPTADTVGVSLPNDATAPGTARRVVRDTLTGWRLPALVDSCVLTVSELVTNAVRHGLPPLGLRVRRWVGGVRIDVSDGRPEPLDTSSRRQPVGLTESGRGLGIVRAVADDLGSEHVPGDGKYVYASWTVPVGTPIQPATPGGVDNP